MGKCDRREKQCEVFDKSKEAIRKQLASSNDTSLYELIIFFEYFSPNTSSNLSYVIDAAKSEAILSEMLKKGFALNKNYVFTTDSLDETLLEKYSLNGALIESSCKRFVCNVCPKDKKNNLTSLMRHIRNSIAHGRYAIIRGGNYYKLFFEDVNRNNGVTFRMVTNHSTLKKWKEMFISDETNKKS